MSEPLEGDTPLSELCAIWSVRALPQITFLFPKLTSTTATSTPPNTAVPDAKPARAPSPAPAATRPGPSAPGSAIQAPTSDDPS